MRIITATKCEFIHKVVPSVLDVFKVGSTMSKGAHRCVVTVATLGKPKLNHGGPSHHGALKPPHPPNNSALNIAQALTGW